LTRFAWQLFFTARQFIKNLENWVCSHVSPSSASLAARQFHLWNPKITQKRMSCLTVVHHPPDGFWKIPETRKLHDIGRLYTSNFSYISCHLTIGNKSNDEAPPSRCSPEKLSNRHSTDWISQRAREMQRNGSCMVFRLESHWFRKP